MKIDKETKIKNGSKVVEIYWMQPTFKNIMCTSRQLDACLFRIKWMRNIIKTHFSYGNNVEKAPSMESIGFVVKYKIEIYTRSYLPFKERVISFIQYRIEEKVHKVWWDRTTVTLSFNPSMTMKRSMCLADNNVMHWLGKHPVESKYFSSLDHSPLFLPPIILYIFAWNINTFLSLSQVHNFINIGAQDSPKHFQT